MAGYMPSFLTCITCGKGLSEIIKDDGVAALPFDISGGGIVCPLCNSGNKKQLKTISIGTLKTLDKAVAGKVKYTKLSLDESGSVMPDLIANHVGRKLKSFEFIERIKDL